MRRHWSTRLLGVALALVFGVAMAGPETHQCPVHDQHASPAAHHQTQSPDHQDSPQEHCTCPQACCPVGVGVALPATARTWTSAAAPLHGSVFVPSAPVTRRAPKHLLPFALAPPRALV